MKKGVIILFIALAIVLCIINYIKADSCTSAWPIIGNVQCHTSSQILKSYNYYTSCETSGDYLCTFNFNCNGKVNCHIDSSNIYTICPPGNWRPYLFKLYKDGSQIPEVIDLKNGKPNIANFQSLIIKTDCLGTILGWDKSNIASSSSIAMSYQDKYLYDNNPNNQGNKVDSTIGCNPVGISYVSGLSNNLPYSWIDTYGNIKGTKPTNLLDNLPSNMNDGASYSYLYGWSVINGLQTINGKDGNIAAYCGGDSSNRNLLSVSKIINGANCYITPTSFQRNVECCNNDDCKLKDPSGKSVCDPTTFTCTLERPCNIDNDCSIIAADSCNNKIINTWKCDQTLAWKPYSGTCKLKTFNVSCCQDNECGTNSPFGGVFCNQNNIFQNYINSKCQSPGKMNSTCINTSIPILINSCGQPFCQDYGTNYCKNGDVYRSKYCYDNGCSLGTCFSNQITNESIVQVCNSKICEDGICSVPKCKTENDPICNDDNISTEDICLNPNSTTSKCDHKTIICFSDSMCGNQSNNKYCIGNQSCNEINTPKCISPGTSLSYCSINNDKICNICDFGCNISECYLPPEFPLIYNPQEGNIFSSRKIFLNISVKKQVKNIRYQLDGKKSRNGQDVYVDLCKGKCVHLEKNLVLLDGNHTLGIVTINEDNRQYEDSVNFYVDSIDPKITKTLPKNNARSNGSFSIEFTEINPLKITLFYGTINNMKSYLVDISKCSLSKSKYVCGTNVDVSSYYGQSIQYSFKVEDIAGNFEEIKKITVKV